MELTKTFINYIGTAMKENLEVASYIAFCNYDSVYLRNKPSNDQKRKMEDMLIGISGIATKQMLDVDEQNADQDNWYCHSLEEKIRDIFQNIYMHDIYPSEYPGILLDYTCNPRRIRYETAKTFLDKTKTHDDGENYKSLLTEVVIETFLVKKLREFVNKENLSEIQAITVCFIGLLESGKHFETLSFTSNDEFMKEFESYVDLYIKQALERIKEMTKDSTYDNDIPIMNNINVLPEQKAL